jgi:hypothetical protein
MRLQLEHVLLLALLVLIATLAIFMPGSLLLAAALSYLYKKWREVKK